MPHSGAMERLTSGFTFRKLANTAWFPYQWQHTLYYAVVGQTYGILHKAFGLLNHVETSKTVSNYYLWNIYIRVLAKER